MYSFDVPSLLKAARCFGFRRPRMPYVDIVDTLRPLLEAVAANGFEIDPKVIRNAIDEGRMGATSRALRAGFEVVGDFGQAEQAARERLADVRVRNHDRLGSIARPHDLTGTSHEWFDERPAAPPRKRASASRSAR